MKPNSTDRTLKSDLPGNEIMNRPCAGVLSILLLLALLILLVFTPFVGILLDEQLVSGK